jgi:hypothetical protein
MIWKRNEGAMSENLDKATIAFEKACIGEKKNRVQLTIFMLLISFYMTEHRENWENRLREDIEEILKSTRAE